jgi:hypothetical protein
VKGWCSEGLASDFPPYFSKALKVKSGAEFGEDRFDGLIDSLDFS